MNDYDIPCKTCGHQKGQHIYCEGACRPGFECEDHCEKFVPREEFGVKHPVVGWICYTCTRMNPWSHTLCENCGET